MSTEAVKTAGDVASIAAMLGSLGAVLPPLAALFTIIWTGIRIYETKTVQDIIRNKDE